jgi:hypothetical protein
VVAAAYANYNMSAALATHSGAAVVTVEVPETPEAAAASMMVKVLTTPEEVAVTFKAVDMTWVRVFGL